MSTSAPSPFKVSHISTSIKEDDLIGELRRHSKNMEDACRALCWAKRNRDIMKAKLDVVIAELNKAMRLDPDAYGLPKGASGKVTDDIIKAAVPGQPEYQEVNNAVIEANYQVGIIGALVSGLQDKRYMLTDTVKMIGLELHSEPSVASEVRETYNEQSKRDAYSDVAASLNEES
jgi:hypothetical protein